MAEIRLSDLIKNKEEYKLKIEIIGRNREKIEKLNEKLTENKEKLKNIKHKLLLHYNQILNDGRDIRAKGLSWVIKSIWQLGHNIMFSSFPNFLDEKSIEFLYEVKYYR